MPMENGQSVKLDTMSEGTDTAEIDELLLQPFHYLARNPGKELRIVLIHAFNHWLNVPTEPLQLIVDVIQMLHNASLIVDDIEDNSTLRRGQPAAHCVYGTPLSINSANMVYFLALDKLTALNRLDVFKVFSEQMVELHRGQGMDILWSTSTTCPSEDSYREMVVRKTGGLFGLAVRLLQLFSDNQTDFKPLIDTLGLLFQIRDDYANLVDDSYHKAKTFAEDISEGKYSFLMVRAIRGHPEENVVENILRKRTSDLSIKLQCVRHMADLGVFDETAVVMSELENRCHELIDSYGGNRALTAFLHKLGNIYRSPDDGTLRKHTSGEFGFPHMHTTSPKSPWVNDGARANGEHSHTCMPPQCNGLSPCI